jgi:NADPH-dependent ferric siderophore reductase
MTGDAGSTRIRRPPPEFRRAAVVHRRPLGGRLQRVTLAGEELVGFTADEPGASLRLLLPSPGADLVVPTWTGNEFLLPDGSRPVIRTLTPFRTDAERGELDVCVVVHGDGRASTWAARDGHGDAVAISGPGRGYEIDAHARRFLIAGDETAIPAIIQVLAALPTGASIEAHVEVATADGRFRLTDRDDVDLSWHEHGDGGPPGDGFVAAVLATEVEPDARVWVAGEAAAVQRVRRHLFETVGIPRERAVVRGYWKHGRRGT